MYVFKSTIMKSVCTHYIENVRKYLYISIYIYKPTTYILLLWQQIPSCQVTLLQISPMGSWQGVYKHPPGGKKLYFSPLQTTKISRKCTVNC